MTYYIFRVETRYKAQIGLLLHLKVFLIDDITAK